MANKKQKGGYTPTVNLYDGPEKHKGKRIWDVPLKDLKDVTKKRIKRRVTKVKKKIGETTLKDIAKRTSLIGPVIDIIKKKKGNKKKLFKKEKKQLKRQYEKGGFLEPKIPNLDDM